MCITRVTVRYQLERRQTMIKPPKGIEFHREFAPDMKRMVQALKVLLESKPAEPREETSSDQPVVKEETA